MWRLGVNQSGGFLDNREREVVSSLGQLGQPCPAWHWTNQLSRSQMDVSEWIFTLKACHYPHFWICSRNNCPSHSCICHRCKFQISDLNWMRLKVEKSDILINLWWLNPHIKSLLIMQIEWLKIWGLESRRRLSIYCNVHQLFYYGSCHLVVQIGFEMLGLLFEYFKWQDDLNI